MSALELGFEFPTPSEYAPAVYLDLCALSAIADSLELSERFSGAMHRCGGTLMLSIPHLWEMRPLDEDGRTSANCSRLLRHVRWNPIDHRFRRVASKENTWKMRAGTEFYRCIDVQLGINTVGSEREPLAAAAEWRRLGRSAEAAAELRDELFSLLQERDSFDADLPAPTAVFANELLDVYRRVPIRRHKNDGLDLFHAVVPTVYCDWVVLDTDWRDRVRIAQKQVPTRAIVYGAGPDDLARLIGDLSSQS